MDNEAINHTRGKHLISYHLNEIIDKAKQDTPFNDIEEANMLVKELSYRLSAIDMERNGLLEKISSMRDRLREAEAKNAKFESNIYSTNKKVENSVDSEESFQSRVQPWLLECFGEEVASDVEERKVRFLEEALELVQSSGCTPDVAHNLVDYVFSREVGEMRQEVGGVMVTLASFCLSHGIDMHQEGKTELERVWTKIDRIREKQAAKPKME